MEVSDGDTVSIVLSKGSKQSQVPSIIGFTLTEAERVLEQNNLKLGNIKYEYNDIYKEGIVLNQTPSSGLGDVSEGDKVDVVVSKGPRETQEEDDNNSEDEVQKPSNPGGSTSGGSTSGGSTDGGSTGGGSTGEGSTDEGSTDEDTESSDGLLLPR